MLKRFLEWLCWRWTEEAKQTRLFMRDWRKLAAEETSLYRKYPKSLQATQAKQEEEAKRKYDCWHSTDFILKGEESWEDHWDARCRSSPRSLAEQTMFGWVGK